MFQILISESQIIWCKLLVLSWLYTKKFSSKRFNEFFTFITASGLGLGLTGSGSLTPPPPNAPGLTAAQAAAAAGGLGLFGGQRFTNAAQAAAVAAASQPGADRTAFGLAMAYATAAARTGGTLGFGSNNNLFNQNTKTRHNSIDRASNNRSLLLEDFR